MPAAFAGNRYSRSPGRPDIVKMLAHSSPGGTVP